MSVTSVLWMYYHGYTVEYRKSKKDEWKEWKPENGFGHIFRINKNAEYRN